MRIGYARVSTDDQTLDLQRDALKRAKCRQIYQEHASGKNTARPELEACLKSLRKCKVANYLRIWAAPRKLSANGSTLFANGSVGWSCPP
jgi:DNA invertase Pin-like site-specific DNA recombinase